MTALMNGGRGQRSIGLEAPRRERLSWSRLQRSILMSMKTVLSVKCIGRAGLRLSTGSGDRYVDQYEPNDNPLRCLAPSLSFRTSLLPLYFNAHLSTGRYSAHDTASLWC